MKKFVLFILLIMSVLSCRKVISIDENYHAPAIVVNSVFSDLDDTISVYVTEGQAIYGYHEFYRVVDDAKLALYKNDVKVGDFELSSDSLVRSKYSPGYGAKYDIAMSDIDKNARYGVSVIHPSMGEAYAETSFPAAVQIDSMALVVKKVMDYDEMVDALVLKVTFTDPAGEDNYYQLNAAYVKEAKAIMHYDFNEETEEVIEYYSDTLIYRTNSIAPSYDQVDPMISPNEDDLFGYSENQFLVFDDELIDGKSYTLQVVLDKYVDEDYLNNIDTLLGECILYDVGLRTIPKDLYLYYCSVDAFYWNAESVFAEPVQIYSNVENGVGILSTYRKTNSKGSYGSVLRGKTYLESVYY